LRVWENKMRGNARLIQMARLLPTIVYSVLKRETYPNSGITEAIGDFGRHLEEHPRLEETYYKNRGNEIEEL